MARTYGAIYVRIWRDPDWRDLDALDQYMYMTLCSQAKLNRAGLLEYSPRRWAEATRDLTPADVEVLVKGLVERRYLVLDESTNELLIRTYVRNDEAWKQPKVMAAVVSAAKEIDSPRLRRALFLELDRIPVGELSDVPPANGGLSIRAKVEGYIAQLRVILRDPEPDGPARTDRSNQPKPHGESTPNDTPGVPEARAIDTPPVGEGTRVRAHLAPVPVPVPVPVPTPLAYGALFDLPEDLPETANADKPRGAAKTNKAAQASKPNRHEIADALTDAFWEVHKGKLTQTYVAVRAVIRVPITNGTARDDLARALDLLARQGKPISGGTIRFALTEIEQQAKPGNVIQLSGYRQNTGNDLGGPAHLARALARAQAREAEMTQAEMTQGAAAL